MSSNISWKDWFSVDLFALRGKIILQDRNSVQIFVPGIEPKTFTGKNKTEAYKFADLWLQGVRDGIRLCQKDGDDG